MTLDDSKALSLWRRRVDAIPSLFARLIYLSSLKETEGGLYFSSDLDCDIGENDRSIRELHLETFLRFLSLSLKDIARDLEPYLETFGRRTPQLNDFAKDVIPTDAALEDVTLFLGTVQIIDALLNSSHPPVKER